jgi:3-oxoacyl-[acyl-carrier protein] reductase
MSLNGKYALITGSSRGIGRGIALKLAENGSNVAIHYYRNETAANDTLAKVREKGPMVSLSKPTSPVPRRSS